MGTGQQPDLQKMRLLALGMVVLTVHHARARHALHFAGCDGLHIAHAVLMRECTVNDVADNFHVTVRVRAKACSGRDAVLIDDAQIAPAHMTGVVVASKRKAVKRGQPAVIGKTSLMRWADTKHEHTSLAANTPL